MDRIVIDCGQQGCRKGPQWVIFRSDRQGFRRACNRHLHQVAWEMMHANGFKGSIILEVV